MTITGIESTPSEALDAAMTMATDYLLDQLDGQETPGELWARTLDCGTVRLRIRVDVEPTGLTPLQAAAAVVASDPSESAEVRAAAGRVLAGGPGLAEAVAVLSRTGPWPGP